MRANILKHWKITVEEFSELVNENPSLRGITVGYLAEYMLRKKLRMIPEVTSVIKNDDHDRTRKGDFILTYKGKTITIEVYSEQSGMR
jgi:hypothetical protein